MDYERNKNLVKKETGNLFRRKPIEYKSIFDFENKMEEIKRKDLLDNFLRNL